eukprot:TRINITY_DN18293_c1_g1_i3.p1 TRINITY_DN18293_c1_g1~~TRINITY_DN18293_c1_g1_i3.p1  ORF type:complete len:144 (+),score=0.65 TRINITY_DN18293_c1_g1_i3:1704-2135(+)
MPSLDPGCAKNKSISSLVTAFDRLSKMYHLRCRNDMTTCIWVLLAFSTVRNLWHALYMVLMVDTLFGFRFFNNVKISHGFTFFVNRCTINWILDSESRPGYRCPSIYDVGAWICVSHTTLAIQSSLVCSFTPFTLKAKFFWCL